MLGKQQRAQKLFSKAMRMLISYFPFLSLQRPDENLDVSLSVPQYNGHPPPSHIRYHNLNDQVREEKSTEIYRRVV